MSDEKRTPATESSLDLMPDAEPEALVDSSSSTQAAGAGRSQLGAEVLLISEETALKVGQDQGRASTPELLPAGLSPHWLFLGSWMEGCLRQAQGTVRKQA